jgi:hypothetical protein
MPAIRTYQAGGAVDPQQLLDQRFAQQQEAIPIPTPPAGPSPVAAAPAPAPPTPAPAIQTQQPTLPPPIYTAPTDDDDQYDRAQQDETKAFDPGNVYSHRGDFRSLAKSTTREENPEWSKYQEAEAIYNKYNGQPKIQKQLKPQLNAMLARINNDTKAANTQVVRQQQSELSRADEQRLNSQQMEGIQGTVKSTLDAQTAAVKKAIDSGTPQDVIDNTLNQKASPLGTMKPEIANRLSRNLVALNHLMSPDDGVRTLLAIGTPPRGKGINGYSGRAAANYQPYGVDVLGNRILKTSQGFVRISPDDYDMLSKARQQGYKELTKYSDELQKQRAENAKPDMMRRAIDWASRKGQELVK